MSEQNISSSEQASAETSEPRVMSPLDMSPEIAPTPSVPDPEIGPAEVFYEPMWAKIVSAVFSPVLIPTYCMILALWLTDLAVLPESVRLGAATIVFLLTGITPMIAILTMMKFGVVSEFDIKNRVQRFAPAVVMILCYLATAWYIYLAMAPVWLVMLFVAGAASTLIFIIFNFFTKISGHALAMGTMVGLVAYLGANGEVDVTITPWLVAILILAGLVASARVALGRHTLFQVALGFFTGAVVTYLVLGLQLFERYAPEVINTTTIS